MDFVFESEPDPALAAKLAERAFGRQDLLLNAARFAWTYGSQRDDVILLAALKDGDKVGQGVFLLRPFSLDGRDAVSAQYVDLFVDKAQRGGPIVMGLYKRLLDKARQAGVDIIFATPNLAARDLNRKLMGLTDLAELPYRIGLANPLARRSAVDSLTVTPDVQIETLVAPYCQRNPVNAPSFTPDWLAHRLRHPNFTYSVHMTDEAMLIASPRTTRGIPLLIAAAFLVRSNSELQSGKIRGLLSAAAAHHRRPVFIYSGINEQLESLPGTPVASRFKPPVLVQGRILSSEGSAFRFDRLELLDFDFV